VITHCLDTDILSAWGRRVIPATLVRKTAEVGEDACCTTAITVGEIAYGVAKRADPRLAARAEQLLSRGLRVFPFDAPAARVYGSLRATLEGLGEPLAEPDLRIASIALSRALTVVTHNTRHFERVPDLRVEDWLEDPVR
jgi:tRNA(fMet)-specific endonuclease VapC